MKKGLASKVQSRLAASGSSKVSSGKHDSSGAGGQPSGGSSTPGVGAPGGSGGAAQSAAAEQEDSLGPLPGRQEEQQQQQQQRGRLERQYSTASSITVDTLDQIELEVLGMAKQSEDYEEVLQQTAGDKLEASMRNGLAQLHGNLNRILATRIDAILTGDLVSGQADARTKRKALIKTVESLIETVEGQVKRFDAARKT
jgi:hypothetical protein